ncbi:MAG TPA: fibronectin type III domain-containing protein [Candidatus Ruthenibacterium merdavium]|uniref:Basal-body rod modification protein FlgD n=1 Tax=Candidatus Ruthenibacterium merdavium TaxID=2838752 RepID=A0A9D2Q4N2_9FIRM|nr:fibronectin type III domain-containing protein [Candidatus Ruthenibacterium merdavium]
MADAVSGLTNSTANYATKDSDRVMGSSSTGNNYNAVFTDESDNSILDPDQFLNLLVLQMQNQDFMNPMDDTTYITQMTQFSNMQQMQKMAEYSQTSYAMSLVGKTVTASRIQVNGSLDTTTGVVDKVSLLDGEYVLYVGGKTYTLSQIMSIQTGSESGEAGKPSYDTSNMELTAADVKSDSIQIKWPLPTEDTTVSSGLTYSVYYSEEGPFDTLESVEKGMVASSDQKNITEETIKNLKPDTEYYVNVVVKDANGNKSIYKTLKVETLPEQGAN